MLTLSMDLFNTLMDTLKFVQKDRKIRDTHLTSSFLQQELQVS